MTLRGQIGRDDEERMADVGLSVRAERLSLMACYNEFRQVDPADIKHLGRRGSIKTCTQ